MIFRYINDLFCVFHGKDELKQFFIKINSIHENIQFTKKLEQHNQLPYLDVLITKSVDKFETTVFRKKTNTNLYMIWSSLCPTKFKRNLLKCLSDRAYRISSSYKVMHLEYNNITEMLLRNGYPLHFIQNQISRFLDNKYCKSNCNQKSEERIHRPCIILKLPFIGDHSLYVEKELQSFFHRYLSHNLNLNVVHNCFKIGDKFKHKEH